MEFEENNVEIEGNSTRNLKEKHKEFLLGTLISTLVLYLKQLIINSKDKNT
jgi:hypothetical protein